MATADPKKKKKKRKKKESLEHKRNRILVALGIFAVVYALDELGTRTAAFGTPGDIYASFVLFLVPFLIAGYDVLQKAFNNIRRGKAFDESFLMAVATIGAFAMVKHGVDVIVGERVENVAAVAAELDQVRLLKRAQLVRYCRLRGCGRFGDVSHAELAAHEGIEDLDACGVAKDLEQVGQVVQQLLVGKVLGRAGGGNHGLGGLDVGFRFINADAHCNILSYEHALI
jgi:hypothetical protein